MLIELVYALKENRRVIEEEATHRSYDMVTSVVRDRGFTYFGIALDSIMNTPRVESVYLGRASSASQAGEIGRVLEDLKRQGYDITYGSLPVRDKLIDGSCVGRQYDTGGRLALEEPEHKSFQIVLPNGSIYEGTSLYDGRHIISVTHTGDLATVRLGMDFNPVDTELIEMIGKVAFTDIRTEKQEERRARDQFEGLLGDLKIEL